MENVVLTHYTSDVEAVASILRHGFFFSFQPTGTFQQVFAAAGVDALEPDRKGMVCFTEMDVQDAAKHRSRFGRFGLALSKFWLVSQGARRVVYVAEDSLHYQNLVDGIRQHAPRIGLVDHPARKAMSLLDRMIEQRFMADKASRTVLDMSSEYLQVLDELMWVQVASDQHQAEWRIRNPSSFGGTQDTIRTGLHTLKSFILMMARTPEEIRRCAFFAFPSYALRFFVVPTGMTSALDEIVEGTPFAETEIVEAG